jgi:hypothetical protein
MDSEDLPSRQTGQLSIDFQDGRLAGAVFVTWIRQDDSDRDWFTPVAMQPPRTSLFLQLVSLIRSRHVVQSRAASHDPMAAAVAGGKKQKLLRNVHARHTKPLLAALPHVSIRCSYDFVPIRMRRCNDHDRLGASIPTGQRSMSQSMRARPAAIAAAEAAYHTHAVGRKRA